MNIISVPASDFKDGLELEEIREAVADMCRYEGENVSGSYTIIGSTVAEQSKVVTATVRKKERTWIVIEAHEATDEEREKWEEIRRRPE